MLPAFQSINDDQRWNAVLSRDRELEGAFVYAVRSTGIYCRVGCPSRRPRRPQVEFFPIPAAAEQAGYRACRRCHPKETVRRDRTIALVERACRLLEQAPPDRLTLAGLGRSLRVSPPYLQRAFARVTGVSPRAYADALRARRLRSALRAGETVSRALYGAGYGSPSRVYEHRAASLGMTPATYRRGGAGMRIRWTIADSPLGSVLVAATPRGLCFVSLGGSAQELEARLDREFPKALRARDDAALAAQVRGVLSRIEGRVPRTELPLDIRATAFQRLVWEELRRVPSGSTVSYAELARRVGRPAAVRAVARAVASNPVAVVVPCHRVVHQNGELGGYRWGIERKQKLLDVEGGG